MIDVNQLHLCVAQAVKRIEMILQRNAGLLDIALREKCAQQLHGGQQPSGFDA